jgi:uncharacterized protein
MRIVGRKEETKLMRSYLNDEKAHLVAVVGRRRVGKTFLVREVYKENKVFEMIGFKDADLKTQHKNFSLQIDTYFPSEKECGTPDSWLLAFNTLTKSLTAIINDRKPVVFFDELPWIAGKRSGFTEALAHWWNNWASQQNIIVIICGSAASWMLEHVVNAKGGLHNRITKLITLMPFSLKETKEFIESQDIQISNYQIIQLYLVMGGIPFYLEQIRKGKSAIQNIQDICFTKDGILRNEFENLYPALFDNAGNHIKIIKAIATKLKGVERQEILKISGMTDGGWFSNILKELESSGFISSSDPMGKKKKDTLYRLTDEYSYFYLRFIESSANSNVNDWINISAGQEYKIWCGYAFESLCLKHVDNIKHALGISGVQTQVNSFLHRKNSTYEKGFQIDMLIDRKDDVINLCEMKFHSDEFTISTDYAKTLRTKKEGLKAVTGTKKMVHTTFITTYGVLDSQNKIDLVDNDFTIELFFE